ncbi:hypothetical protein ASD65_05080 [Microbacterium sp. Root61]|uniref:hypothetical protein n=1 Tax=Microbacterium sp. Root61 TaxID=1736570 RepID=UPI0006F62E81|nr:hypothetical protein [Microbacterium sp. Root61]KRA23864.1 hypothetical protein ASD65_05080 [Microbacterium sp. Root61]
MDGRTKLAIGGVATLAMSVAVVCAVAVSNAAALSDTAGAPLARATVQLPPAASPTASSTPQSTAHGTTAPETVPAAEPAVIPPVAPALPAAPAAPPAPAPAPVADADESKIAADAVASGRWADALEWARNHGWSEAKAQAWAAWLKAQIDDKSGYDRHQPPANAGSPSDDDQWSSVGSKKDQSRDVPPRWRD